MSSMYLTQLSAASGTGRISQEPMQYPLREPPRRTQASASAVDIEAHWQPAQSLMLQRRGLQRANREPNLDDTAAQRRHSHRRNIALQLAALNALTYLSLIEKYIQLRHTTSRDYERFEKLITDREIHLSDFLVHRSDLAFDIELSEYINNLSVEDINLSISGEATAQYYESLIDGYHRMYRASTAHCTLVQKANNMNIPQRFDYCGDNYQEYVAAVFEEHQTNRKRLKTALNRAGQLLSAIRTAMANESLDHATLARLKLKLIALQVDYPEAYQAVHGGSQRDLFDPGADQWWNTSENISTSPARKDIGHRNTSEITAQRNTAQVTAQRNTAKIRSTLGFVVPTCCILSCIPAFLAWRCSSPGRGTNGDSTFYELLTGLVIQALGLGAMLWPALSSKKLGRHPRMYAVVLAVASAIFMLASVPMYLWVSVGWGPAFSWLGAVAQTLVLLQLTDGFLR